ncbi:hypothetical protein MASR2M15_15360 [Anaerolineales bacterium]
MADKKDANVGNAGDQTQENRTDMEISEPAAPNPADVESPYLKDNRDGALAAAWRRMIDYDKVALQQKRDFSSVRSWVISLSLLTSAGGVMATFLSDVQNAQTLFAVFLIMAAIGAIFAVYLIWHLTGRNLLYHSIAILMVAAFIIALNQMSWLSGFLRAALIIMPIASVALLNFASQYATSSAWIEYRYNAELIRTQIYLYRTRSGPYFGKEGEARQEELLYAVAQIDGRLNDLKNFQALPFVQTQTEELDKAIEEHAKRSSNGEDLGMHVLDPRKYLEWRLRDQLSWYINKVKNDYKFARRERIASLAVAGLGSLLVALDADFAGLVAITTAAGIALSQWSEIRMHGATYANFHRTALQLQNKQAEYSVRYADNPSPEMVSNFIQEIEAIFANEQVEWRKQAMERLMNTDQSIMSTLKPDVLDGKEGADGQTVAFIPPQMLSVSAMSADPDNPLPFHNGKLNDKTSTNGSSSESVIDEELSSEEFPDISPVG